MVWTIILMRRISTCNLMVTFCIVKLLFIYTLAVKASERRSVREALLFRVVICSRTTLTSGFNWSWRTGRTSAKRYSMRWCRTVRKWIIIYRLATKWLLIMIGSNFLVYCMIFFIVLITPLIGIIIRLLRQKLLLLLLLLLL